MRRLCTRGARKPRRVILCAVRRRDRCVRGPRFVRGGRGGQRIEWMNNRVQNIGCRAGSADVRVFSAREEGWVLGLSCLP